MSIEQIIRGCIDHEPKAQKLLYNQFRGYACKVVFRYIYRYERAMDIVTDGFVKIFLHFGTFKKLDGVAPEILLKGWLKKIMINCCIDELRKTNMPEIGGISPEVWDIPEKNNDADRLVLYKDIISLVKELPYQYGAVFNLYVIDGYSHSQIAEMMHISVSTSRSNLSRAKVMLQELINKMEDGKLCRI